MTCLMDEEKQEHVSIQTFGRRFWKWKNLLKTHILTADETNIVNKKTCNKVFFLTEWYAKMMIQK